MTVPVRATPPAYAKGEAVAAWARRWTRQMSGTRVVTQLALANVVIDVIAFVFARAAPARYVEEIAATALVVTLVVNFALVRAALLPLRTLEAAADRVASGDLAARVHLPAYADRDLRRVGIALNHLLDTVAADRARVHTLAAQAIHAGDQERASIARELHDSTAQHLAALDLLLSATARENERAAHDVPLAQRLGVMQELVGETLHEVRNLSHTVHPRVLEELGLTAALEALAARTREAALVEVWASSDARAAVPPLAAATLYRVAQEALRNAIKHAAPRRIHLVVTADAYEATLTVDDDGRGFDFAEAERARAGMGLFTMRERVGLVGGRMRIVSRPGQGTRVQAIVPVATPDLIA